MNARKLVGKDGVLSLPWYPYLLLQPSCPPLINSLNHKDMHIILILRRIYRDGPSLLQRTIKQACPGGCDRQVLIDRAHRQGVAGYEGGHPDGVDSVRVPRGQVGKDVHLLAEGHHKCREGMCPLVAKRTTIVGGLPHIAPLDGQGVLTIEGHVQPIRQPPDRAGAPTISENQEGAGLDRDPAMPIHLKLIDSAGAST